MQVIDDRIEHGLTQFLETADDCDDSPSRDDC
jgi:hypothetical protein